MKNIIQISELIKENASHLSGVFTTADLSNLIGTHEKSLLPKQIRYLIEVGLLSRFARGLYFYPHSFSKPQLSQKLCPRSYLSLETVLATQLVIGTIPEFRLSAVKVGRSRLYQSKEFAIEHLGIQDELFFGFSLNGLIYEADPEKAVLDCLYFYQKGRKPAFNIYEDINKDRLDLAKTRTYLSAYKNLKFVKFAQSILEG